MRYPARLGHLATRAVVTAKLVPSYLEVHQVEDEEATERVQRALATPLLEEILAVTWTALLGKTKKLDENGLLEKVAKSLQDRPLRAGRTSPTSPAWSAFWVQVDVAAGTASDAARKLLDSEPGKKMVQQGLAEAGQFLASELTR